MSHTLLRRIAVGSGALTLALITGLGGVAAADEAPAGGSTATSSSTAATPTSDAPTSGTPTSPTDSSTPASSSTSSASSTTEPAAKPKDDQPAPKLDIKNAFDKATYNSGDDVNATITITNTGTADAHGIHVTTLGGNLQLSFPNWPDNVWFGTPGLTIAQGDSLVLAVTGTILDSAKPISLHAAVYMDPSNNSVADTTVTATVVPTRGDLDGTLYFDANGNGQYDAGEGLAGVDVKVSGGAPYHDEPVVKTDKDGKFKLADIPSGSYGATYDGLGGLVTPYTPWHVRNQTLQVAVQARHKVSDAVTASVKLDSDTYAVGDTAHITVTLTNKGDHAVSGITAACNRIGDSNNLSGTADGWGDLRYNAAGVTVPAHGTLTVHVTEPVPAAAHRTGYTALGCDFGQFGENYEDGSVSSNGVFASVPGAVASVEGSLVADKNHDNTWTGVPGVKFYLTDHISKKIVASTATDAHGKYAFASLPAGLYDVGLVGPWKLTEGESDTWPFWEGDNTGRDIAIEPGPDQPDPTTTAPTTPAPTTEVPVSPVAQASPELAYTGVADVLSLSLAALGAMVCGVSLVLMSRRRRGAKS